MEAKSNPHSSFPAMPVSCLILNSTCCSTFGEQVQVASNSVKYFSELGKTGSAMISTLSVNSGDYLEKHLKQTVKWIEENSNIEILAVGIGHDVTRYYKKAIKIADVQELGDVMINQLTKLFSQKSKETIH